MYLWWWCWVRQKYRKEGMWVVLCVCCLLCLVLFRVTCRASFDTFDTIPTLASRDWTDWAEGEVNFLILAVSTCDNQRWKRWVQINRVKKGCVNLEKKLVTDTLFAFWYAKRRGSLGQNTRWRLAKLMMLVKAEWAATLTESTPLAKEGVFKFFDIF